MFFPDWLSLWQKTNVKPLNRQICILVLLSCEIRCFFYMPALLVVTSSAWLKQLNPQQHGYTGPSATLPENKTTESYLLGTNVLRLLHFYGSKWPTATVLVMLVARVLSCQRTVLSQLHCREMARVLKHAIVLGAELCPVSELLT